MKKNFTVNISGSIFNIDDDAYDKLNNYLQSIKKHYKSFEGADDIISDIEARIAEMLQEKMSEKKQVVTLDDISEVIKTMGQPHEFESENIEEEEPQYKRTRAKRLFRDPDNRIIAGVSSGLGAYFNIDPIWFRLTFIGTTFIGGSGLIVYIIMWLVVPEATTTSEKIEMQGDEVNIANIEKRIKEEVNNLEEKLNNLTDKAKQAYKKKSHVPANNLKTAGSAIGSFFKGIFKVILIIIGIIFILTGVMLTIGILIPFFNIDSIAFLDMNISPIYDASMYRVLDAIFVSHHEISIALIGLALVIGIPILMLVIAGIRLLFGIKASFKPVSITALIAWIVGVVICGLVAAHIVQDFDHKVTSTQELHINQPLPDTLYLVSSNGQSYPDIIYHHDDHFLGELDEVFINERNEIVIEDPLLNVLPSNDNEMHAEIHATARGRSKSVARKRAKNILYGFDQTDSSLVFDPHYRLAPNEEWREQYIKVQLEIPEGQIIIIDSKLHGLIKEDYSRVPYRMFDKPLVMKKNGLEAYQ